MPTSLSRREYMQRRRTRNRAILDERKNVPCMDCKRPYPICVMQFDHVRGKPCPHGGLVALISSSTKQLMDEIAKCDVVCANCHCIRTYNRRVGILHH